MFNQIEMRYYEPNKFDQRVQNRDWPNKTNQKKIFLIFSPPLVQVAFAKKSFKQASGQVF